MLDDFMVRAGLAALAVVLATAPLGCFVVWRRMAYFSDATAHAAVLGVAIALAFEVSVFGGVVACALAMAILVTALSGRSVASDTLLGVLAHSSLAIGLVAVSLMPGRRVDLTAYLFGDILAVSKGDLAVIWAGAIAVVVLVVWRWSALLTATLSADLARAAGIRPRREEMVLTLALAVTVAVAIKVVGALLIGAMLVIPAASARRLAASPETMAVLAGVIGVAAALGGLWLAYQIDAPAGPSIVCVAAGLFSATMLLGAISGQK